MHMLSDGLCFAAMGSKTGQTGVMHKSDWLVSATFNKICQIECRTRQTGWSRNSELFYCCVCALSYASRHIIRDTFTPVLHPIDTEILGSFTASLNTCFFLGQNLYFI
jgi:hypothetical protein